MSVVVPRSFKAWLAAYCDDNGVKASELLRLLIVREKRLQRLSAAAPGTAPEREPCDATVTAYFSTQDEIIEFDAYARTLGMTRREAGLILLLMERSERWMDRSLSQP